MQVQADTLVVIQSSLIVLIGESWYIPQSVLSGMNLSDLAKTE